MNTADYCPLGQKLQAKVENWEDGWERFADVNNFWIFKEKTKAAELKYRQHVDECNICKGVNDAEKES